MWNPLNEVKGDLAASILPTFLKIQKDIDRMSLPTLSPKTVSNIRMASDAVILQCYKELSERKDEFIQEQGSETYEALWNLLKKVRTERAI